jgi:hypothetical protein
MQNFRRLRVIQPVVNRQHYRRALFRGKFQHGGLHLLVQLTVSQRISSIRMVRGNFPGTVCLKMKPPRLALTPVEAGVDGDPVKPGGKFRRAAKGSDLLLGADESLLGKILGVRKRAGHPICERMDHVLMIAYQRFKSRRVAILTLQHQFFVGVGHTAFFYPV